MERIRGENCGHWHGCHPFPFKNQKAKAGDVTGLVESLQSIQGVLGLIDSTSRPGTVARFCNSTTQEGEEEGSKLQGHCPLHSKFKTSLSSLRTCLKTTNKNKAKKILLPNQKANPRTVAFRNPMFWLWQMGIYSKRASWWPAQICLQCCHEQNKILKLENLDAPGGTARIGGWWEIIGLHTVSAICSQHDLKWTSLSLHLYGEREFIMTLYWSTGVKL